MSRNLVLALSLVIVGCGGKSDSGATCGPYSPAQTSMYVLPYQVGLAFVVGQGNCSQGSHNASAVVRHAYDILMPIGTPVVAARSGSVFLTESGFTDGNRTPGQENFVNIEHDDGTIAAYVHLTNNGVFVNVGDPVLFGDVIGASGDTGDSSEPHLHFHVQGCDGCATIPVTFRNTRSHANGLVTGESYLAEPYE
jgi:murein DD-endopeptidase MepM/ murein hydrolase activator NlpD